MADGLVDQEKFEVFTVQNFYFRVQMAQKI